MTRPSAKQQERFFVEEAARHLGKTWELGVDREHPDFVVTEDGAQFGLEVTGIFRGAQRRGGSALREKEVLVQRSVDDLQREYEAIADVPLKVHFVGNMEADNLAAVVPALVAQDFPSKPISYRFEYDTTALHPDRAPLHVYVTKGLRPEWYSINDRAGFVDRNPHPTIAAAIKRKANRLAQYRATVGDDVRLLIIANRFLNSGKLLLEDAASFDFHGFSEVYFFSYPEAVIVLNRAS